MSSLGWQVVYLIQQTGAAKGDRRWKGQESAWQLMRRLYLEG